MKRERARNVYRSLPAPADRSIVNRNVYRYTTSFSTVHVGRLENVPIARNTELADASQNHHAQTICVNLLRSLRKHYKSIKMRTFVYCFVCPPRRLCPTAVPNRYNVENMHDRTIRYKMMTYTGRRHTTLVSLCARHNVKPYRRAAGGLRNNRNSFS